MSSHVRTLRQKGYVRVSTTDSILFLALTEYDRFLTQHEAGTVEWFHGDGPHGEQVGFRLPDVRTWWTWTPANVARYDDDQADARARRAIEGDDDLP